MINKIFPPLVFMVVLFGLIHPVQGQEATIKEILELSGLKTQIEHIPAMIRSGLMEQEKKNKILKAVEFNYFKRIIEESYHAGDLYRTVYDYFKDHYERDRFLATLELVRSPLWKKMTQMEEEVFTPQGFKAIQKFSEKIASHLPSKKRLALVRELDYVSKTTELSVELQTSTVMVMVRAFNAATLPSQRVQEKQLRIAFRNMRSQFRRTFENISAVTYLYIYRSVSDQALEQYIQMHRSKEGRTLTQLSHSALVKAMTQAAEKVGLTVARKPQSKPI